MIPQIVIVTNPFNPLEGLERYQVSAGQTIRQWLASHYGPDFIEFERPTALQFNGELLVREEWDRRIIKDGDVAIFIALPGEVVTIIIAIVAIIVAVAAYLLMPDPRIPQDQTNSPNSVYTLRGQSNQFRPGEPIEVVYGRCRRWPTYICRPYSEYVGNEQYQYSLFCIGQGSYDIEVTQLDDTPTGDFNEVQLQICPPGTNVTLVESSVTTSLEVSNIELLGPNEDLYDGPSGPFTLNEWDSPIHRIAVDVSFPQGLYSMNDKGKLESESVTLLFEYRSINEAGAALGAWTNIANPVVTRSDNTPQRITFSKAVPAGRYEVRGRRSTNKPGSTRKATMARWEAVKGYAQSIGNFGDVTVIAMKALATNNLNDQSAKAFNVICTRKVPTWSSGSGWSARVATRNPIWSFCDLFRSVYGAKLPDLYLDLPTLKNLADTFDAEGVHFDWIFDSPMTIWEAAKMILRVGRAVPVPRGSLVTAVRDVPQTLPSAVFNQHNIVQGTLSKRLAMFEFQPFDGLTIEYTDPDTWKPKEVNCVLPGRSGLNLDRLKLPGVTSRNRAYQEGMHIQARRELQRKTVIFQTGLEGHIPAYLDLVSITHDTVRVGQGGMIMAYDSATNVMTLSEQVQFATESIVHKIAIRGDDGAIIGSPITCTPGPSPNKVVLASDPSPALDFSENRVPPLYAFGVADLWSFLGKVIGIRPIDSKTVELTVVNYVSQSYDYEDSTTVDAIPFNVIRNRTNPQVGWVTISAVPDRDDRVFIDWLPEPGSASYVMQTSYDDGATWNAVATYANPPVQLQVNAGTLKVRVAPFSLNGNVIYTVSNSFVVGSNIATPTAPEANPTQNAFDGLVASAKWNAVNSAQGYIVYVYLPGGVTPLRSFDVGTALIAEYTRAQYEVDTVSVSRVLEFQIRAFNAGGEGDALTITRTNPAPTAATALTVGTPSGSNYPVSWTHTLEADMKQFNVYASTTMGFTPGPGNLVATVTTGVTSTIPAPTRPVYWRVGAVDVWGPEITLSDEGVIP
jgi:hypothetical protein